MLNKNVADYTNFDGKTNKKIVQAPGGATHFSLAWSDEKTDYGPERVFKKKDNSQNYNDPPQYQNTPNYQKPANFNYNEPIRLMQQRPQDAYSIAQKQEMYSVHSVQSVGQGQGNKKYGGEYGYNNYTPQENYRAKQQYYQQDSLDQKLKEEQKGRNSSSNVPRPPPSNNIKPSIKLHQQKASLVIGDDNYNYWKDNSEDRKSSNQSNRRPPLYEQPISQYEQRPPQQPYPEKTSVKVHNPPGGKSSFTLG